MVLLLRLQFIPQRGGSLRGSCLFTAFVPDTENPATDSTQGLLASFGSVHMVYTNHDLVRGRPVVVSDACIGRVEV